MTAPDDSPPAASRALTVKDIARAAEVSPMTVSRVLAGGKNVRPAVREHVERVIAELGYHRNENARSLRPGQRSGLVGVMITNIGNPYYAGMVQGVDQLVSRTGRRILVGATNEDPQLERQLLSDFVGRQVEGLIVVPVGQDPAIFAPERLNRVPLVLASRTIEAANADAVLISDVVGARDATRILLAEGHRRIAFLGNKITVSTGQRRLSGFRAAHAEQGVEPGGDLIVLGLQDAAAAQSAMDELLDGDDAPTAVFAANNRISTGVIRALSRRADRARADGREPEKVRLFAFDSFEFADMAPVPLSVIDHDPQELGRTAAQLLLSRLDGSAEGREPRLIELPVTVVDH